MRAQLAAFSHPHRSSATSGGFGDLWSASLLQLEGEEEGKCSQRRMCFICLRVMVFGI